MKKVLKYIWQLPQNLLGLAIYHYYKGDEINTKQFGKEDIKCKLSCNMPGGISLGNYVIVSREYMVEHELGHCKQSRILGPLYLLVIGLPSITHAWLHSKVCKNQDYSHFYTEKWANKLMGL